MRKYHDDVMLPRRRRVVDGRGADRRRRATGIDVCLAGLQKAFSLPAGLAVASRLRAGAGEARRGIENRGYYFDLLEMLKYDERRHDAVDAGDPADQRARRAARATSWPKGVERADLSGTGELARDRPAAGPEPALRDLLRRRASSRRPITCVANTRGISVADLNAAAGSPAVGDDLPTGTACSRSRPSASPTMGDTQEWEIRGLLATIERILDLQ